MSRVLWAADAKHDLRAIIDYFEQIAPDLADRLIDSPRLGPKVPDSDIRIWRASAAPFLLFYREKGGGVRILKDRDAWSDWKPRG